MSLPLPRHHRLAVMLTDRPVFVCCCWGLSPEDTRRARRVFRVVRKLKRAEAKAAKLRQPAVTRTGP